jgi:hypothetical protein
MYALIFDEVGLQGLIPLEEPTSEDYSLLFRLSAALQRLDQEIKRIGPVRSVSEGKKVTQAVAELEDIVRVASPIPVSLRNREAIERLLAHKRNGIVWTGVALSES